MGESDQSEPVNKPEYNLEKHNSFIEDRQNTLAHRVERVLGNSLIVAGTAFALTGIGDFLTGGKVSEFLASVGNSNLPDVLTWASQHLAELPQYLKTGGGSSMIGTGVLLVRDSQR